MRHYKTKLEKELFELTRLKYGEDIVAVSIFCVSKERGAEERYIVHAGDFGNFDTYYAYDDDEESYYWDYSFDHTCIDAGMKEKTVEQAFKLISEL